MTGFAGAADELLRVGHAVVRLPPLAVRLFPLICDAFDRVDEAAKRSFSFPHHDDGFLPFGLEHAQDQARPDLCERFCYWRANEAMHRKSAFSGSPFYRRVAQYEDCLAGLAEALMSALAQRFCAAPLSRRAHSYVQLCAYQPWLQGHGRRFLQDPHEDGHLLSFAKQTSEGLALETDGGLHPVRMADDEVIVFSGSLLTALTDGAVAPVRHAVLAPAQPKARKSVMYFLNPNLDVENRTFGGMPVDLRALANERHMAFGNAAIP